MNPTATKVSVGLSTVFGLSTSAAAFVAAAISAASGDRTPETLAAIGAGVVSGVAVIVSRGRQAVAQTHAAPRPLDFAPVAVGEIAPRDPLTSLLSAGTVAGTLTVTLAPPTPEAPPETVA